MNKQNKSSWTYLFGATLTEATLLLAALLIIQCLRIYVAGISPENMTQAGVRINDIYSPAIVSQYFSEILWMVILWVVSLGGTIAFRILKPQEQRPIPTPVISPEGRLDLMKRRITLTPEMQAEEQKRRKFSILCAVGCAICAGMVAAYMLNLDHFASRDLEMVIAAMMLHITPWIVIAFAALMALAQMRNKSTLREIQAAQNAPKRKPEPVVAQNNTLMLTGRIALGAGAIALLIAGVLNGGMYDVLVKAINICTECIGLG
ncbi:MAG: CD1871A family CXXC motif-containing protein [Clostridia bacterium]